MLKRLQEVNGAEGEMCKKANKVNKLGRCGGCVQKKSGCERARSHTHFSVSVHNGNKYLD